MNIKFLGIITLALHLTTPAYGINHKRLELEAGTYHDRIWSRVPSDQDMVKRSLAFLGAEDPIDSTYTRSESMRTLHTTATAEINDEQFLRFSNICLAIFEGSNNDVDKASIYMLLEKVKEKSLEHLQLLKRIENLKKKQAATSSDARTRTSLDYFLNFDSVSAH